MEHWQKITVGTIGGLVATIIFYFIMGKFLDCIYLKKQKKTSFDVGVPQRHTAKKPGLKKFHSPELERFIHEEFESPRHECVVVVGCNNTKAVGICAFLQEMRIEYFVEQFPDCCLDHFKSLEKDDAGLTANNFEASQRTALTAISCWAKKWALADSINFLSPNETFVLQSNDYETHTAKFMKQLEEKFDFKLYTQWTDNFLCDNYANEELWEGLIVVMKQLLAAGNDISQAWIDFPCEEWPRTKVHVNGVNFHQLPHPGKMAAIEKKLEEKLVDI